MTRELDLRTFGLPPRKAEAQSLASTASDALPGSHKVKIESFDPSTGNPWRIVSLEAPAGEGYYIQRALEHLAVVRRVLGLAPAQAPEFIADPHVQRTSSGAVAVNTRQYYKAIPIFHSAQTVTFSPHGAITDTTGSTTTVRDDIPVAPTLSVEEAVLRGAQHLAVPHPDEEGGRDQFGEPLTVPTVDLSGFVPKVTASFEDRADQPTVLEVGPFGDKIKASLVWFPMGGDLRLAWTLVITMPEYRGQYQVVVDSKNGEILYCRQRIHTVLGRGNVYRLDGSSTRQMTEFPRLIAEYGLPIPAALPSEFPDDWIRADSTVGNCVNAHQEVSGAALQGAIQNGVLTFDPANPTGVEQQVLNIFYFNGFMHDYFYLLGFRESDGNFQDDNHGRGGAASDAVDARAHPRSIYGTANMATPIDGSHPVMNMGLVTSTSRHTALDSSVVFHEFTHGVTNRLVGGSQNVNALDDPQCEGMGEGWSDYIPCTINNTTVVGAWVANSSGGIRNYPYDSNYPRNFGDVGRVVNDVDYSELHNMGEIWCATLMEVSRNIGNDIALQTVIDALKLSPANPSFLDMRDAILQAVSDMLAAGRIKQETFVAAREGMWRAFAKFGMGPAAQSDGAQLSGIVADFSLPSFGGQQGWIAALVAVD